MAQRIVDPLFTSGLEYAMSVAGGENVPSMIAPGVGYSEEFPMGYTMEGGVPSAVAPPVAPPPPMQPIAEEPMFRRAPPAMNGRVPDPRDLPSPTGIPYIDELNYRLATPPEGGLLITPEEEMAVAQVRALGLGQFTPPVFGSGLPMTDGEMAMFDLDPEGYEFATPPAMPAPMPQPVKGYTPFDFTNIQAALDSVQAMPMLTRGGGRNRR